MTIWHGAAVAKIDAYYCLFVAMLAAAFLVTPAPPVNSAAKDISICSMAIDITWPSTSSSDVDLWAMAPDGKPVGYSSKTSPYLDLVRDDLGYLYDATKINAERVCARGLALGEYIANVHLYRGDAATVEMVISKVNPSDATMVEMFRKSVTLERLGDEITVVRFRLDKDGNLIQSSVHDIPRGLRTAK